MASEKRTNPSVWVDSAKRYVAFFDIMGFKELVERNAHDHIVEKLRKLKNAIGTLESLHETPEVLGLKGAKLTESKIITFSDSIVIFSKDDSEESLFKIIVDASAVVYAALNWGIPIKGALSYGDVTVDFTNSLFFGRPIIDSYLLHDQVQLYTAVLDDKIEERLKTLNLLPKYRQMITHYKAHLKGGRVTHYVIRPPKVNLSEQIGHVENLYNNVSGAARIYIDNTLEFLRSLDV